MIVLRLFKNKINLIAQQQYRFFSVNSLLYPALVPKLKYKIVKKFIPTSITIFLPTFILILVYKTALALSN